MDIKRSWNVPLTIWFDSGSIGNFKIIPILAGLMIACTSLFHANSNKTNNIQSDHQHILSSINAAENYHPINFILRCSNLDLGSPLVNKSLSCWRLVAECLIIQVLRSTHLLIFVVTIASEIDPFVLLS